MRFGFTRSDPSLPAIQSQTEILVAAGCEDRVLEVESGSAGARRFDKFLGNFSPGDVVCVVSFDVFDRSPADLIKLLRNLAEMSVAVCIAARHDGETLIRPQPDVVRLLQLLSVCEAKPRTPGVTVPLAWYGRPFLPAEEFTPSQREHAQELYAKGMSLRAIGLIFRTSPGEIMKVVSESRRPSRSGKAERDG